MMPNQRPEAALEWIEEAARRGNPKSKEITAYIHQLEADNARKTEVLINAKKYLTTILLMRDPDNVSHIADFNHGNVIPKALEGVEMIDAALAKERE